MQVETSTCSKHLLNSDIEFALMPPESALSQTNLTTV